MKAKRQYKFEPDYAVAPGVTVKEVMESLDMTQKEFAIRTDLTVQSLNRIFKGEQPITYDTAEKLEMVTGTPAHFWNNLEMQYQEQLAKLSEKERLKADLEWLKMIPVNELKSRGIIPESKLSVETLKNTLKFYGVNSVKAWNEVWECPEVAARRSQCFDTKPGPASTWIRLGELQAQDIQCNPYNKELFLTVLNKIRTMTYDASDDIIEKAKDLCAEAGVALTLVKEVKKVPWSGAAKWVSSHKAMILLNLRGKSEDKFWFSFYHEAGHILHDSKKDLFINDGSHDDPREKRADEFAENFLIPKRYNEAIANFKSKEEIKQLAGKLNVSPGIIVGRFHHLTQKWSWFKDLINKYQWSDKIV